MSLQKKQLAREKFKSTLRNWLSRNPKVNLESSLHLECNDIKQELTSLKNKFDRQQKNLQKKSTLMNETQAVKEISRASTLLTPATSVIFSNNS